MFTLTITTRDYIPFTIKGSATDLTTAAMVMQAGLQVRQNIGVKVSSDHGSAQIDSLRDATHLLEAVTECIAFCTPE